MVVAEHIGNKLYANFNNFAHISHMAYIFAKTVDGCEQKLLRCTRLNTQLHNRDEFHRSRVSYLPTIDVSKTKLDTVNLILIRTLEIAGCR